MFIDLAAGLPNVKAGKLRVLAAAAVIPMPLSAQEFKAYADQERAAWADVIKKAGIKLE